jgi:hypothetical protein
LRVERTTANGDWRVANGFPEGSAPALPKNSAHQDEPSKFSPNEFGAQEKSVINHWLKPVA